VAKITQKMLQLVGPTRVPGQFYIRNTKYGPVAQAWPKKRPKRQPPGAIYAQEEWKRAIDFVKTADPQHVQAAMVAADGSLNVARDLLIMSMYGTLTTYFFDDGTEWQRYRDVTVNAQYTLDQVTDDPNSMMWRRTDGWHGIQPTAAGQYVYWDGTEIRFVGGTPPASPQPTLIPPGSQLAGTGSNVAANTLHGAFTPLRAGVTLTGIAIFANAAAATSVVKPILYRSPPTGTQPLVAQGPQVTGVTAGLNFLPFDAPYMTTDDSLYLPGVQTLTALWSQVNTNSTIPGWVSSTANPVPTTFSFGSASYANTTAHPYLY
jgi:hypothetical protein